jgi:hypothetical protein
VTSQPMPNPVTGPRLTPEKVAVVIDDQPSQIRAVRSPSRFARRVPGRDGHLGQSFRDRLDSGWIDAVEEASPNAGQVDRPRGLQFGHTPRSELGHVHPCVGGTGRLRHQAAGLEIVDQARHPARRQIASVGQVGHPTLAIGTFGKVHDRRVLARRQAGPSDQVTVQMPRDDFDNSHHGAPERFLGRRERFDSGHTFENNLLDQATARPSKKLTATSRRFDRLAR